MSRDAALQADWLGASRRAAEALRDILLGRPTTAERVLETGGRGQGGDRTLQIDADAEAAVFTELERLHAGGARFTAVSEERGRVDFGDDGVLVVEPGERRNANGLLEVLGIESADPRWVAEAAEELARRAHRVRALGTIAVTLCQVAGARMDGMVTLKRSRAVDTAAGQLIVREAGGHVAFTAYEDPLGAPLDTEPRSAVVAARTPEGLAELLGVPRV